jgi:serine/threonine protein kinase/tetratricopeptide (TPR) repeat protein
MKDTQPARVRLGVFELDLRSGELRAGAQKTLLREQPLQVLRMLVESEGELITREEIRKKLWPNDTIVDFDHSINAALKNLRRALGDSAEEPKYIETVARRGYRLMVPVEWMGEEDASGAVSIGLAGTAVRLQPEPGVLGKKVSHYRVLQVIGAGEMGLVYSAEDLKLGRQVALKFLPEELSGDAAALQRFEREAQTASSLNHPNICTIHEVEEHEAKPFIVMELLAGETLRDRLARASEAQQALPLDELLNISVQISAGLQAAHGKGIIHRDIKPANIFLTDSGAAKILDFGVAKLTTATGSVPAVSKDKSHGKTEEESSAAADTVAMDRSLTRTGAAMGTVGYMSPEQVRGEQVDARTDLFSLGLVLYEMATGQRAFDGETQAELRDAILNRIPVPVHDLNPTLPPKALEEIIGKALEKDRERRYQSAAEMRADLQQLKRDSESATKPSASTPASGTKRNPWRIMVAAATTVIALTAVSYFSWRLFHRTPKLTNKDIIVLADFTNSAGDAVFDDTMKQALSVGVAQSPFFNILSEQMVQDTLKLMGRSAGDRLTPEIAVDLCQRANANAVIDGSIDDLAGPYVIGLKAINCHSGDVLAQEQVTAPDKSHVLRALAKATSSIRSQLGESLTSIKKFDVPLEQATTTSIEALQAYSLGRKAEHEQGDTHAIPFYRRAISLDPDFAMAHVYLGIAENNVGEVEEGNEEIRRAFDLRNRTSDIEQLRIATTYYAEATGQMDKAVEVAQLWAQTYPRDPMAQAAMGGLYMWMGKYPEALASAQEQIRLDPHDVDTYENLEDTYLALNRFDEAQSALNQTRAQWNNRGHFAAYELAFLRGDQAGMQKEFNLAQESPQDAEMLDLTQAGTEAFYGRVKASRDLTQKAVHTAQQNGWKESAGLFQLQQALREAEVGFSEEAIKNAQAVLRLDPTPTVRLVAALALARAGDVVRAGTIAESIDREFEPDSHWRILWNPVAKASIALHRGDPEEAIKLLDIPAPVELGSYDIFPNATPMYPAYIRGEAYLRLHQGAQAAAEYQKILDHRGIVLNAPTAALSHLGLARAYALEGNTAKSKAAYQEFLTIWKDADSDIPIYQQAKSEYAKLQ